MDQTPPRLRWTDSLRLGEARMDATHAEFVTLVNALLEAEDAALPAALDRFAEHARRHFGDEDRQMRETDYPSAGCHLDEHAAVLASVDEVREVVARGRHDEARRLATELARWFPEHTTHMDSGLAMWVIKRTTGGAPLVFRRRTPDA
jgi:hemerythrin